MNTITSDIIDIERQNAIRYLEDNAKENEKKNRDLKIQYKKFLDIFTKEYVLDMRFDDYCIGKKDQNNFSYYVERTLGGFGSILGSPSNKFGIYYSKNESNYVFTKRFGKTKEEALENVKKQIVFLIESANNKNIIEASKSIFSYMYKYKIYFLYSGLDDIPIFNEEHIDKLVSYFAIEYKKDKHKEANKREALYNFKKSDEVFSKMNNIDFMRFVYSPYFGLELKDSITYIPKNNDSIEFIVVKQLNRKEKIIKNASNRKVDYSDVAKKMSSVGDMGERLVLQYEKSHNPSYAKKIKRVSLDDDSLGYDILSYDELGNVKYIEVKTKKAGNANNVDFYITDNELQRLKEDNHVIYYVCGITTNNRKIYAITKDVLDNQYLDPVLYHIKAKVIK